MKNYDYKECTFHNAATAAADGTEMVLDSVYTTLRVDIDGAVTSSTVAFIGKGPGKVARAIVGCKEGDTSFTMATSTSGTAETWVFDVSGMHSVIMDLTAIVAGTASLTVKGRAV